MGKYDFFVEDCWINTGDYDNDMLRTVLGIVGESGEIAEKFKKALRGDNDNTWPDRAEVLKELGDVLFYITKLAHFYDADLQEVIDANVEKLSSRKDRGVLKGSGDNR